MKKEWKKPELEVLSVNMTMADQELKHLMPFNQISMKRFTTVKLLYIIFIVPLCIISCIRALNLRL